MKKIVFGITVTFAILFNGCGESDNKESAEVKKAKEIMAKKIIEEEEKREKNKKLREYGPGDFSNAK